MKSINRGALCALAAVLFLITPLQAQLFYTAGHGDLGISYTPGESSFGMHWGVDAGATVGGVTLESHHDYQPAELVAWTTATASTPSNSSSWLGIGGGTQAYRLGSDSFPPNLGFNTSGAGIDSNWVDSTMFVTLSGWTGPGDVALRNGGSSGSSTIFSTFDPGTSLDDNTWGMDMGVGHIHLVWYFSQPGTYELTFDWASTYIGGVYAANPLDVTGTGTYRFQVGVIPEPKTWALLLIGVLAWAAMKIPGRKAKAAAAERG